MPHFDITAFLVAAIGVLGLISLCLLVFGRLGIGSIVAFLVAGIVIGQVRDIPAQTILAVREFAEIGVVLLLFSIGLEIRLDQLRRLGRDVLAFGVPQITLSALLIGLYVWWGFAGWEVSLVLGLGFAHPQRWSWSSSSRSAMNCTRPGVARRLQSSWLKTSRSCRCYCWSHSWPSGKAPVLPAGHGCGRLRGPQLR